MVAFRAIVAVTLVSILLPVAHASRTDDAWKAWWREVAKETTGLPYRYGGEDPRTGIDCSAFVRWIYTHIGIKLPRTSRQQWRYVAHVRELKPGYLVFFSQSRRQIDHVGIYIGDGLMLHASGKWGRVVVEPLKNYEDIFVGIGDPFRPNMRATESPSP